MIFVSIFNLVLPALMSTGTKEIAAEQASVELPLASTAFTAIEAGEVHTCGLTAGGGVKCWGGNLYGLLGDETNIQRSYPVNVVGLTSGVTALASGVYHTCALMSGGGVKCWGDNRYGQLGDGTYTDSSIPVNVIGLSSGVIGIAAGGGQTCALMTGGGVKCWGINFGSSTPVDVVGLSSGVIAITMGGNQNKDFYDMPSYACVLMAGKGVKCWGENDLGELGDGTNIDRQTPVDVVGLSSGVIAISAGGDHTCALTVGGGVKCWGNNYSGELGDGSTLGQNTPVDVVGLSSGVIAIASGGIGFYYGGHTCAQMSGGEVKCWGDNDVGQLGDGTTMDRYTPVNVVGITSRLTAIAAGGAHTCALTAEDGIICWGSNSAGQLGDGRTINRSIPVDVDGLSSGIVGIAAGGISYFYGHHTCALTAGGGIMCWGNNAYGQLGDGTSIDHYRPENVVGLSGAVTAIAAGGYYTCALTAENSIKCWGNNESGQLGNGTTTNSSMPVDVVGLSSGATAVTAGGFHTCALTVGGGVKCWGGNHFGQLGDGSTSSSSLPVNVKGLSSGVLAISAGGGHHCALLVGGGGGGWGG
jgi:alpha-tubulin suppressor-like RCC1 family protein